MAESAKLSGNAPETPHLYVRPLLPLTKNMLRSKPPPSVYDPPLIKLFPCPYIMYWLKVLQ